MGYIERTLGQSERLYYKAGFHWSYHAAAWGVLFLFLAVGLGSYASDLPWVAFAAGAIGLALFLAIMIPIWTTEIGVTSQRLIFKRGLLERNTDELQLRAIEEVNIKQSVLGRLLGYGRIEVHGTGVDDVLLPIIADPLALSRALHDAIGATAPPSAAPNVRSS